VEEKTLLQQTEQKNREQAELLDKATDAILVCDLVNRHAAKMSKVEILAVAANFLGKVAALQDQRVMTSEKVMKIVVENFQLGNQQAVAELSKTAGNG